MRERNAAMKDLDTLTYVITSGYLRDPVLSRSYRILPPNGAKPEKAYHCADPAYNVVHAHVRCICQWTQWSTAVGSERFSRDSLSPSLSLSLPLFLSSYGVSV